MTETEARLNSHEAVCAERYEGIKATFKAADERIELQFAAANARLKRLEQIMIGSAAFSISLLLALVLKLH